MAMVNEALNEKVHALLLEQIARGTQLGTQVCVYLGGEKVVDTWAGQMGPRDPRPVGPDTLFSSFSTTKGVAATALHILADRGVVEYEQPVARYWEAFGQRGKAGVTVAQAMSHQAGLHAMPMTPEAAAPLLEWENGVRYIEAGVPAWEPGTATGYHAITFGWVVGGIIEHADGRHIQQVLAEEIAGPLGLEGEMFIGIPEGVEERLATLLTAEEQAAGGSNERQGRAAMFQLPPDHDFFKAMPPRLGWNFNDMRVRRACLPAANGHFTARALAKMYGALANGGVVDGVRLVSKERISLMSAVQTEAPDRVLVMPLPKSIGFFNGGAVAGQHGAMGPRKTAFGHPGAGGSIAFADPETGLAVAVTINKMQSTLQAEGPTFEICELVREELGLNG